MPKEPISDHNKFLIDKNREDAKRAHDEQTAFFQKTNDATVSAGIETLKAILIVNGGACGACLAFSSQIIANQKTNPERALLLAESITYFAYGVASVCVAFCFGYFTNFFIGSAHAEMDRDFEYPYVKENNSYRIRIRTAKIMSMLAFLAVALSIWFFLAGVMAVRIAIQGMF